MKKKINQFVNKQPKYGLVFYIQTSFKTFKIKK